MAKNVHKQLPKKRKTVFTVEAADAKEVFLVGEFNGWKVDALPMRRDENGRWIKALMLPEGRFEYKFLIDEQWMADPANESECVNCFGTRNSIVSVTL